MSALELLNAIIMTLSDIAGEDRAAAGLAPLASRVRAGPAASAAAGAALASLSPVLLAKEGLLWAALDPALASDVVTQSAYGLVGEVSRCIFLWPGLESSAPELMSRSAGLLAASMGALEARAGQKAADDAARAAGQRLPRQVFVGPSGYTPNNHALGNILWAMGQIIGRLGVPGAQTVAAGLAPTLVRMFDPRILGPTKLMYTNAASALLRLCARGAQDCVFAACQAAVPAEARAGVPWLARLAQTAGLFEDQGDMLDAVTGLTALLSAQPQACFPALVEACRLFGTVCGAMTLPPQHLARLAAVLNGYKSGLGAQGWAGLWAALSKETQEELAKAVPGL